MRISEALRGRGVITDFRPPNVIRIAPIPLYNTYDEIWQTVRQLKTIVDNKEYAKISKARKPIS